MSPKLPPVKASVLVKIFKSQGFVVARQKGSHISMSKQGCLRPIIIPDHGKKEVNPGVYQNNMRTAGMSRDKFFELYDKYK